jgi:hypothetical protein
MTTQYRMVTTDMHPDLSPMERHVAFIESREGNMSQQRYFELLKIYFAKPKKKQPIIKTKQSFIRKLIKTIIS